MYVGNWEQSPFTTIYSMLLLQIQIKNEFSVEWLHLYNTSRYWAVPWSKGKEDKEEDLDKSKSIKNVCDEDKTIGRKESGSTVQATWQTEHISCTIL